MIRLNGKQLTIEKFPNNETKFKDFDNLILNENILELKYVTDQDLIYLLFAKNRIDEVSQNCTLFIWYMPYSRMDRKIDGDLFTLQYICNFINSLKFTKVVVMEPHSKKTIELLDNSTAIYPVKDWLSEIKNMVGFTSNDTIVFPDKGAAQRYKQNDYDNICVFEKNRNPYTGVITDMYLKEGRVKKGTKCIIIDDLCSKGGTFMWSASILKRLGAAEIYLAVAHCEKTIFEGDILKEDSPLEKVFTSTSMLELDEKPNKIEFMKVEVEEYV